MDDEIHIWDEAGDRAACWDESSETWGRDDHLTLCGFWYDGDGLMHEFGWDSPHNVDPTCTTCILLHFESKAREPGEETPPPVNF